ncbi:MAG: hypothetical protein AAB340_03505 [Patescibacteria group bacterium]
MKNYLGKRKEGGKLSYFKGEYPSVFAFFHPRIFTSIIKNKEAQHYTSTIKSGAGL